VQFATVTHFLSHDVFSGVIHGEEKGRDEDRDKRAIPDVAKARKSKFKSSLKWIALLAVILIVLHACESWYKSSVNHFEKSLLAKVQAIDVFPGDELLSHLQPYRPIPPSIDQGASPNSFHAISFESSKDESWSFEEDLFP
jgi:hypothetical protein